MFKITTDTAYIENRYSTPTYILQKQLYLPHSNYNTRNTDKLQLFRIYNELLNILVTIRDELLIANELIEDDLLTQLATIRTSYPIVEDLYAKQCSTTYDLIYANNIRFADINITNIYQAYKNRTDYTLFGKVVIRNYATFVNELIPSYNYNIDTLNNYLNSSYTYLPYVDNYVEQNYIDIIDTNITTYKDANNNL